MIRLSLIAALTAHFATDFPAVAIATAGLFAAAVLLAAFSREDSALLSAKHALAGSPVAALYWLPDWAAYAAALLAVIWLIPRGYRHIPRPRYRRAPKARRRTPRGPIYSRLDVADGWKMDLSPGRHTLIAGATGSGKGGALWAIVAALKPDIESGTVRLVVIDPKGGMELAALSPLADVFMYDDDSRDFDERVAELLESEASRMTSRANSLRARSLRKSTPSPDEPYTIIVIDEILAVTDEVDDPKIARRIGNSLRRILRQGRAPGWTVLACSQDPSKDAIGSKTMRLFPQKIALRLTDYIQVDMVLGQGVRERYGAAAHEIPMGSPGAAYVWDEAAGEVAKIRFKWVSDEDISALTRPTGDELSFTDCLIDAWPLTADGGKRVAAHCDELSDALGISGDELSRALADEGIPVDPRVSVKRDGSARKAAGVRFSEVVTS